MALPANVLLTMREILSIPTSDLMLKPFMLLERLKISKLRSFAKIVIAKFGSDLLVIALFLVLTLILLYPFSVLNMSTHLIGVDGGDAYQNLWNLWWVKHSIISLSNPYMTSYVFYPIGTDLFTHTLSPLAGIFSFPFQFASGLIFSYNFLIILSFVLAGYGTYLLTNY